MQSCTTLPAEEEVGRLKLQLSDKITDDSLTEVIKITGALVKKACERMKPGKNDVSESYTSDVFLNAPDSMFEALAAGFRLKPMFEASEKFRQYRARLNPAGWNSTPFRNSN